MTVYTMISIICVAAAAIPVLIVWIVQTRKAVHGQRMLTETLAPLQEQIAQQEDRIRDRKSVV